MTGTTHRTGVLTSDTKPAEEAGEAGAEAYVDSTVVKPRSQHSLTLAGVLGSCAL